MCAESESDDCLWWVEILAEKMKWRAMMEKGTVEPRLRRPCLAFFTQAESTCQEPSGPGFNTSLLVRSPAGSPQPKCPWQKQKQKSPWRFTRAQGTLLLRRLLLRLLRLSSRSLFCFILRPVLWCLSHISDYMQSQTEKLIRNIKLSLCEGY